MADRFLPSEQRGSRRDRLVWNGGLLSPTSNIERSLGVDKGVVADAGMVSSGLTMGLSPGERRDGFSCKGGFSSREVVDAGISVGFSCKWESDNGEGVVRSRVNAAQSQRLDSAP